MTGCTLAALEGLTVIWLAVLWMLAGPEISFSFGSLRSSDFETTLVRRPLAVAAGLPFFGAALSVGLGRPQTPALQATVLVAPTLSAPPSWRRRWPAMSSIFSRILSAYG